MNNDLYISGINYESIADGEGCRATIFISGCTKKCVGCQSPNTHSFTNGIKVDSKLIKKINQEIQERPFLSGITLSGGDPMESPIQVLNLIKKLVIPHNNIWCYTGEIFENIIKDKDKLELLHQTNVIVDGPYIDSLRDISLKMRGSSNQRIIDVQKSLEQGKVVLWEN